MPFLDVKVSRGGTPDSAAEIAADAWGYGGRTQEYRYIEGRRL